MATTLEQALAERQRRQGGSSLQQALDEKARRQQSISVVESEDITPEDTEEGRVNAFMQGQLDSGQIVPIEKSMLDKIREEIPQTGGGIAGGVTAVKMMNSRLSQLPPQYRIPATLAVATAGSFAGGTLGKGGGLLYRSAETGEELTLKDLSFQSVLGGIEEARDELIGFGLGKLGGKATRALRGLTKFKPGAKAAARIATEGGTIATKGQLTVGQLGEMFEGYAEKFSVGGMKLRAVKGVAQQEAIKTAGDTLQSQFASELGKNVSPTKAGEIMFDALKGTSEYFSAGSKGMYKHFNKALKQSGVANDEIVSLASLKKFAQAKLKSVDPEIVGSDKAIKLYQRVAELPEKTTVMNAVGLRRSFLKSQTESAAIGGSKAAEGLAKQFTKMTHKEILAAEKFLPKDKEVLRRWKLANEFYASGKKKFNRSIIKQLGRKMENDPQKLVELLFKEEGVTGIARTKELLNMRKSLGDRTWKVAKDALVQDIFKDSQGRTANGILTYSGQKVASQLDNLGPEVLSATFTKGEQSALREFANGASLLQRKLESVPGGVAVPLAEIGAIGQALKGKLAPAAAVLKIPRLVSKIVLNPDWSRIALDAAKPTASQAALVKFANLARRVLQEDQKKDRKQRVFEKRQSTGAFNPQELLRK